MQHSKIVISFGRINPVTAGHGLLISVVKKTAAKLNCDHAIFVSRTQDAKKNPLSVNQKLIYLRHSFPSINFVGADDKIRTFIEAVKSFDTKYDYIVIVAGSDRVSEYKTLLDKYNGKEYNFKSIEVISAGERDPDEEGTVRGISASKMREFAKENNFNKFKLGAPASMSQSMVKKMFDDVRIGMKLVNENIDDIRESYIKKELFSVGDIVIFEDMETIIKYCGSNYVIIENDNITKRVWLKDITPTGRRINEDMKYKSEDKIKIARIIGYSLGYVDAMTKTNPTNIINAALRIVKNKPLNVEAKKILSKMLASAKEAGIEYDEKIISFLDENRHLIKKTTIDAGHPIGGEEEKDDHNLIHDPSEFNTEYERLRKILMKTHESVDSDEDAEHDMSDEELTDLLNNISDDEIIDHSYDDEEFNIVDDEDKIVEEDYDFSELTEVLSRMERMRARVRMARTKSKRERGLRIALKKRSDTATVSRRARVAAVKLLKTRLIKKPLNTLSVSEKERLEQRIGKMGKTVTRIAIKLVPRIRQIEKDRLSHSTTQRN